MKAGASASVDSAGAVRECRVSDALFPTEDDLQQLAEVATEQRRREWRSSLDEVGIWPGLLAHFAFEPQSSWDPVLRNRVPGGRMARLWRPLDQRTLAAQERALEFQSGSDRVRLDAPGEYESMSIASWMRVDALENPFSGLLMSDGEVPGAVHWGIKQAGNIALDVWPLVGPRQECGSGVVFSPGRGSEWTHLAVVIDASTRQVRHYMNGQSGGDGAVYSHGTHAHRAAEIGNWNDGSGKSTYSLRNLNGRVDELVIFGRALKPEEIARLWSSGPARNWKIRP